MDTCQCLFFCFYYFFGTVCFSSESVFDVGCLCLKSNKHLIKKKKEIMDLVILNENESDREGNVK